MTTKVRRRPAVSPPKRPARKAIDPRMRDRRVAVLRAQGRRRLRWMAGLLVVGVVGAAAWIVMHSALLDVERVRVTGTQQATPDQVRFAAGVSRGDAILFLDAGAVARDVERVPWVDKARVERSLGGQLDIHVTERRPAAWVRRAPDQVALVDAGGRVLADAVEPPADLPEIAGLRIVPAPGRPVGPRAAAGVLEKLPPELGLRTIRVVVEGDEVTLGLRDGPEVRFGAPRRVASKARAAVAVLASTAETPPRYIDVRVPGAPVAG
jgi:cell division protein FtsQ